MILLGKMTFDSRLYKSEIKRMYYTDFFIQNRQLFYHLQKNVKPFIKKTACIFKWTNIHRS